MCSRHSATVQGFPHLVGRPTYTAPSGIRQPLVRRRCMRLGVRLFSVISTLPGRSLPGLLAQVPGLYVSPPHYTLRPAYSVATPAFPARHAFAHGIPRTWVARPTAGMSGSPRRGRAGTHRWPRGWTAGSRDGRHAQEPAECRFGLLRNDTVAQALQLRATGNVDCGHPASRKAHHPLRKRR